METIPILGMEPRLGRGEVLVRDKMDVISLEVLGEEGAGGSVSVDIFALSTFGENAFGKA